VPGHVRVKLKDIEDLREAKLQTSLRELHDDHPAINISNIGAMEMNKYVPSYTYIYIHSSPSFYVCL
jgi:hypothetical protein